jgi:limonene-1,2-epoxide hydrolase
MSLRGFKMKIASLLIGGLCWGLACDNSPASQKDIGPSEVVQSKFAAFNQHDVRAIGEIYARAATLNSPDYTNLVGNEAIAETYRKLFDSIPDAQDTIGRLESVGNHVYVQFVLSGHWNGAQDKPVSVRIISVYTVDAGRIVEDATYYDRKTSQSNAARSIARAMA